MTNLIKMASKAGKNAAASLNFSMAQSELRESLGREPTKDEVKLHIASSPYFKEEELMEIFALTIPKELYEKLNEAEKKFIEIGTYMYIRKGGGDFNSLFRIIYNNITQSEKVKKPGDLFESYKITLQTMDNISSIESKYTEIINDASHNYKDQYIYNDQVYRFGDGWSIVYVRAEGEVKRYRSLEGTSNDRIVEGNKMGICLGSSSKFYQDNKTGRIYSLRDPENNPRATFRLNSGKLEEAKGRFNAPPDVEATKHILEFFNLEDENKPGDFKNLSYKDCADFKKLPPVTAEEAASRFNNDEEILEAYKAGWLPYWVGKGIDKIDINVARRVKNKSFLIIVSNLVRYNRDNPEYKEVAKFWAEEFSKGNYGVYGENIFGEMIDIDEDEDEDEDEDDDRYRRVGYDPLITREDVIEFENPAHEIWKIYKKEPWMQKAVGRLFEKDPTRAFAIGIDSIPEYKESFSEQISKAILDGIKNPTVENAVIYFEKYADTEEFGKYKEDIFKNAPDLVFNEIFQKYIKKYNIAIDKKNIINNYLTKVVKEPKLLFENNILDEVSKLNDQELNNKLLETYKALLTERRAFRNSTQIRDFTSRIIQNKIYEKIPGSEALDDNLVNLIKELRSDNSNRYYVLRITVLLLEEARFSKYLKDLILSLGDNELQAILYGHFDVKKLIDFALNNADIKDQFLYKIGMSISEGDITMYFGLSEYLNEYARHKINFSECALLDRRSAYQVGSILRGISNGYNKNAPELFSKSIVQLNHAMKIGYKKFVYAPQNLDIIRKSIITSSFDRFPELIMLLHTLNLLESNEMLSEIEKILKGSGTGAASFANLFGTPLEPIAIDLVKKYASTKFIITLLIHTNTPEKMRFALEPEIKSKIINFIDGARNILSEYSYHNYDEALITLSGMDDSIRESMLRAMEKVPVSGMNPIYVKRVESIKDRVANAKNLSSEVQELPNNESAEPLKSIESKLLKLQKSLIKLGYNSNHLRLLISNIRR